MEAKLKSFPPDIAAYPRGSLAVLAFNQDIPTLLKMCLGEPFSGWRMYEDPKMGSRMDKLSASTNPEPFQCDREFEMEKAPS